jgi:predicted phage terminase large subunit-like protein
VAANPAPPTGPSIKEAAERLLRLRAAQTSYAGFVKLQKPNWELADFQSKLVDILDKFERNVLTRGDIDPADPNPTKLITNLLITMPPRHAKTEFSTKMFPAYCMARKPTRYIMSCSYNGDLAKEFGRAARDYAQEKSTQQAFPDFEIRKDSSAADEWRTTDGGAYFGIGLDGTTSGRPANILIIDDPIKSRKDADSATNRNSVWNFYTSALAMRLQPEDDGTPARQLVILTRWHPDDLAGRIMATEEWAAGDWGHVNFPAITTDASGVEHALWPDRFPLTELKRRERLNPREFTSLYMQSPYILGGNLIKSSWWRYYPADLKPERFTALIVAADTAFKKSEQNDYSVFMTLGLDRTGDIYILDVFRQKLDYPALRQRAVNYNALWRGQGLRGFYIEDKASGQSLIQDLRRESGISVIAYRTGRDKVARVNATSPLIEGGRVFLPMAAPWLDDFIEEAVTFPSGAHDDQVDALSLGLDVLSRMSISPDSAFTIPEGPSLTELAGRNQPLSSLVSNVRRWTGWGE